MTAFDDLLAQHPVGTPLDVDGYPPQQPYQCFDVPQAYIRILSGNPKAYFFAPSGYAKDFYNEYPNSALLQSLFDRLPWDAKGQRGDIAVYGNAPATPDTHVAILEEDKGTIQRLYGQNQPKPYITEIDLTSKGLLGYLRPKTNQSQGADQMIIQNADNWYGRCNKIMARERGRECSRDEFVQYAVGVEFLHWVEAVQDNPEADAWFALGQLGRQAQNENWQGQVVDLQSQLNAAKDEDVQDEAKIADLTKQLDETIAKLNAPATPVIVSNPPFESHEPATPVTPVNVITIPVLTKLPFWFPILKFIGNIVRRLP